MFKYNEKIRSHSYTHAKDKKTRARILIRKIRNLKIIKCESVSN